MDQRTTRRMKLNSIANTSTQCAQRITKKISKSLSKSTPNLSGTDPSEPYFPEIDAGTLASLYSNEDGKKNLRSGFVLSNNNAPKVYNTVDLYEVSKIADRYDMSDTATAAIATATLVDFGLISSNDKHYVVDRCKVRRNRQKWRDLQINSLNYDRIQGLYFDGRIDQTLLFESGAKKTTKEDHISFVQQPDSLFIGHKTVECGKAIAIVDSIKELIKDKSISIDKIKAIGVDGTNVNTGCEAGVIRRLEVEWNQSLQWNVCMLHMNELPLRAIIKRFDGGTSSPNKLTGEIGSKLPDCEKQQIAEFEPINFVCSVKNIEEVSESLSTDQKYLFDICQGISNGCVPQKLARRSIGPISLARWTTTANRVLRLYVSDSNPSATLRTITEFIMTVYAPMIFQLKYKSSITYGSIHLARMIRSCRFLPPDFLQEVQKSIQHNAFFAHPEHVTLAMLNDDNETVRRKGWLSIYAARETKTMDDPIRKFKIPKINFDCVDYKDIIDFNHATDTDPPVLRDIIVTLNDIDFLSSEKILEHDFGNFLIHLPLHTQSVERCVKLVTEASKRVCSEKARDGLIANTLASRNVMPNFASKKDFTVNSKGNLSNFLSV